MYNMDLRAESLFGGIWVDIAVGEDEEEGLVAFNAWTLIIDARCCNECMEKAPALVLSLS